MILKMRIQILKALIVFFTVFLAFCGGQTTVRPYKFGFTIEEQQHRYEQRDERGIVMGEFGFITADGIYHVTVYATDEQGRFRILAMKNYPYKSPPKRIEMELIALPKVTSITTTTKTTTTTTTTQSPKKLLPKFNFNTEACSGCFLKNDIPKQEPVASPKFPVPITPTTTTITPAEKKTTSEFRPLSKPLSPVRPVAPSLITGTSKKPQTTQYTPIPPKQTFTTSRNYEGTTASQVVLQVVSQIASQAVTNVIRNQVTTTTEQYTRTTPVNNISPPTQEQRNPKNLIITQTTTQIPKLTLSPRTSPSGISANSADKITNGPPLSVQPVNKFNQPTISNVAKTQTGTQSTIKPAVSTTYYSTPNTVTPPVQARNAVTNAPAAPSVNKATVQNAGNKNYSSQGKVAVTGSTVNTGSNGIKKVVQNGVTGKEKKTVSSGTKTYAAAGEEGDLYRFKYILDYNGHTETGSRNGNKEGNYFAIGDDNVERIIEYIANEDGFQPRIRWKKLNEGVPSKQNTLKEYEFVWFNKKE